MSDWRPAILAAVLLAFVVGFTCMHACNEEETVDLETLDSRDLLGLSPDFVASLGGLEQAALQQRLKELLVIQSSAGHPLPALALGEAAEASWSSPDLMMAFDANLAEAQLEPGLVLSVHTTDSSLSVRTCLLDATLLAEPVEATDVEGWSRGWTVDDGFETHPVGDGLTEADAVRARLARLEAWIAQCSADDPVDVFGEKAGLRIKRAEGAPFLLAYWPQRAQIELNPLLLMFWEGQEVVEGPLYGSVSPKRLRTQAVALTLNITRNMDECSEQISTYCSTCDTLDKAQGNGTTCNDPLFLEGTVWENCQALHFSVEQGYYRFCLNYHTIQTGNALVTCMSEKGLAATCGVAAASTVAGLETSFGSYIAPSTGVVCRAEFEDCIQQIHFHQEAPKPDDSNWCDSSSDWLCDSYEYCCGGDCNN
ncbi:MAG: hypothetical protein AUK47_23415 [Deltaproteobacteria bacterium CG2_30_63_29]|nr:MAG: hypothetical protein AUK47_23415 [Deltaproteobacteria bacterium CG2_30_63_29]PJB40078.1 MAG: hypothetical protein CO108_15740 [Deltaproteobacteria bacterium CG_4_9_14_3_um_filter_63_12]